MFLGDVTLRGQEATVVWGYHTAAVCRTWTVQRTTQGTWTLEAYLQRADPFQLRQRPLFFQTPRKGGAWCWPVQAVTIRDTHMTAVLGPMEA